MKKIYYMILTGVSTFFLLHSSQYHFKSISEMKADIQKNAKKNTPLKKPVTTPTPKKEVKPQPSNPSSITINIPKNSFPANSEMRKVFQKIEQEMNLQAKKKADKNLLQTSFTYLHSDCICINKSPCICKKTYSTLISL